MRKATRWGSVLALNLALMVVACQRTEDSDVGAESAAADTTAAVDLQAEEARIREIDGRWLAAVQAGDTLAIADIYAVDGRIMPPDAPASVGRDAVRSAWAGILALPDVEVTFEPDEIIVSEAGDLAYDVGTYRLSYRGAQGAADDAGKYVVVWKKVDGEWKVAADIFNSDGDEG